MYWQSAARILKGAGATRGQETKAKGRLSSKIHVGCTDYDVFVEWASQIGPTLKSFGFLDIKVLLAVLCLLFLANLATGGWCRVA